MTHQPRHRRWRAVAAVAVVGALALAGCSDNKSDDVSTGGSDGGSGDTPAQTISPDARS